MRVPEPEVQRRPRANLRSATYPAKWKVSVTRRCLSTASGAKLDPIERVSHRGQLAPFLAADLESGEVERLPTSLVESPTTIAAQTQGYTRAAHRSKANNARIIRRKSPSRFGRQAMVTNGPTRAVRAFCRRSSAAEHQA